MKVEDRRWKKESIYIVQIILWEDKYETLNMDKINIS